MNALLLALLALSLASPPSGRPPTGPLERFDGRLWAIDFEVTVSTLLTPDASLRQVMVLEDTPIVMPVIFNSTFSRVQTDSLQARIWFANREDPSFQRQSRLDEGAPFHTHLAVMPIQRFTGQSLRWQISYLSEVWSSRIDDAGAAQLTWPREWPQEVQDGLRPQLYIESDDPFFAEAVRHVSGDQLRLVPPYLAAKDLVRYCVLNVQVSGDGVDRREFGLLHGLEMEGALFAAQQKRGSPHDLVCVCVAMLRAAGIPARPVIGLEEQRRAEQTRVTFVSWAEFYLEGAGWIPFDPDELRGEGIHFRDVRQPWGEFGTMKDLNRRVPLAYHFIAPASVQSPQRPAVWGWDPRPAAAPGCEQFITLKMSSRGRAPEDPARPVR